MTVIGQQKWFYVTWTGLISNSLWNNYHGFNLSFKLYKKNKNKKTEVAKIQKQEWKRVMVSFPQQTMNVIKHKSTLIKMQDWQLSAEQNFQISLQLNEAIRVANLILKFIITSCW